MAGKNKLAFLIFTEKKSARSTYWQFDIVTQDHGFPFPSLQFNPRERMSAKNRLTKVEVALEGKVYAAYIAGRIKPEAGANLHGFKVATNVNNRKFAKIKLNEDIYQMLVNCEVIKEEICKWSDISRIYDIYMEPTDFEAAGDYSQETVDAVTTRSEKATKNSKDNNAKSRKGRDNGSNGKSASRKRPAKNGAESNGSDSEDDRAWKRTLPEDGKRGKVS